MRVSSSFKIRPQSVETSAHCIESNQAVIKDLTSPGKEFLDVLGKGAIFLKPFPVV